MVVARTRRVRPGGHRCVVGVTSSSSVVVVVVVVVVAE
jgi:hypothetical protein